MRSSRSASRSKWTCLPSACRRILLRWLCRVAAGAPSSANSANALTVGQSLLGQLRAQKAVGRLVIDLPKMMRNRPGSQYDVILRDGDQLIVPRFQQEVTVIGEVQSATSHLYSPDLSRDDYIGLSGGVTRRGGSQQDIRRACERQRRSGRRPSLVRVHGGVLKMKPGDTIVVPLDTENACRRCRSGRLSRLSSTTWRSPWRRYARSKMTLKGIVLAGGAGTRCIR